MASKWLESLKVIGGIAPMIAAAAGGPLAGSAVSALEGVLGLTAGTSALPARQDAVSAAMAIATPDTLLALKQADEAFQEKMAELGFGDAESLAKLTVDDRDSARRREVSVKDWTPKVLTVVIFLAFAGIVVYSRYLPDSRMDMAKDALTTLRDALMVVVAYYFGSSFGSDRKTELLAQAGPIASK